MEAVQADVKAAAAGTERVQIPVVSKPDDTFGVIQADGAYDWATSVAERMAPQWRNSITGTSPP